MINSKRIHNFSDVAKEAPNMIWNLIWLLSFLNEACSARRFNQYRFESLVRSFQLRKMTFNRTGLCFGLICAVERYWYNWHLTPRTKMFGWMAECEWPWMNDLIIYCVWAVFTSVAVLQAHRTEFVCSNMNTIYHLILYKLSFSIVSDIWNVLLHTDFQSVLRLEDHFAGGIDIMVAVVLYI